MKAKVDFACLEKADPPIRSLMDEPGRAQRRERPAAGPASEGLESTGDPSMQLPWTHAGLPVVTLPWGTSANGLPLGLQLVARYTDDERLLVWAAQLAALRTAVDAQQ